MELQKKQTQLTPVEQLLQKSIVQTLTAKRFDELSKQLPSRIQGTFDLPKIREMVMVTGEKNVCGFIEFELIKLAERINVSGNLTPDQIDHIAKQLVEQFPNETIADFKICFEKGASGAYGKIFKLDGIEIGLWMKAYLDEKYQVLESEMMKEKDNQWDRAKQNTDWLQVWKEAIEKTDSEGGVKTTSQNLAILQHVRAITGKEIKDEGKEQPKFKPYPYTPPSYQKKIDEKVRKGRELYFRENYPTATEEQVKTYLESFENG